MHWIGFHKFLRGAADFGSFSHSLHSRFTNPSLPTIPSILSNVAKYARYFFSEDTATKMLTDLELRLKKFIDTQSTEAALEIYIIYSLFPFHVVPQHTLNELVTKFLTIWDLYSARYICIPFYRIHDWLQCLYFSTEQVGGPT
jgi:hypothetical protein